LLDAVARGVRQYVIVGAGLDSFAFRRPAAAAAVRVIEIDTAATLASKRARAAAAGLVFGDAVHLVAADVERDGVGGALAEIPGARGQTSFVACLGILPYLTGTGVRRLLASIATSVAAGSEVAFDYLEPDAIESRAAGGELAHVRRALAASGGEAWRSGLDPAALPEQLAAGGLLPLEDLNGSALQARYGAGRVLRVPRRMHVCRARVIEA
jgi:methyltransferase (TIGR00027 family)